MGAAPDSGCITGSRLPRRDNITTPLFLFGSQPPFSAPKAHFLVPSKPEIMISISKLVRNIFRNGPYFPASTKAEVPKFPSQRPSPGRSAGSPALQRQTLVLQVYNPLTWTLLLGSSRK